MQKFSEKLPISFFMFPALLVIVLWFNPSMALEDFPIGYASTGGTYGFIGVMEQERLLEQQGIRSTFVYIRGVQIMQALLTGDIRVAIIAAPSPILAAAERFRKELMGVLEAVSKALRIYKTDKVTAIRGVSRFMKLTDQDALEETWSVHAKLYKNIPSPPTEGIKLVRDFLGQTDAEVRTLDVQRLIDRKFSDQLLPEPAR